MALAHCVPNSVQMVGCNTVETYVETMSASLYNLACRKVLCLQFL